MKFNRVPARFVQCWLIASFFTGFHAHLTAQCPQLVWEDNFDGESLDLSKWSHQLGDGCDVSVDLCGWGNNELQWYQEANTTVGNGTLKITAKRETVNNRAYTSSRIRSMNQGDWTYGRFEASIKLPTGKGLWPAFWMLSTEEAYGSWPQSGEIDIMELIGSEPEIAHGTIHFGRVWPNNRSLAGTYRLSEGIFNDEFHTFAVEWEDGRIRWYVDDYLYSVKTRADVVPSRWPFDRDFHFLLNVAVGGNWPGNPDGNTVFPQVMEVDYVRVYDSFLPGIGGERTVSNAAAGINYFVENAAAGATFEWQVPDGATIVSGQGTAGITVDWGDAGGDVTVRVTDDCSVKDLAVDVFVQPALARAFSFENFDDPALLNLNLATGTLEEDVPNPGSNAINSSALAGRYLRNANEQFDVLIYEVERSDIGNAAEFGDGDRKFLLDVYTAAPVGTQILLQLENSGLSQPDNFPRGRHSRLEAVTTVQNEWERLEFRFLDAPDNSVSDLSIDRLIFLFASNTNNGDTYYFDNFDVYALPSVVSVRDQAGVNPSLLEVLPNPTAASFLVRNLADVRIERLQLLDNGGRMVLDLEVVLETGGQQQLEIAELAAGVYHLRTVNADGSSYYRKVVKQ